ncbi:MAG: hypothetical protein ACXWXW_00970, partial [Bacteroidia bacterium]
MLPALLTTLGISTPVVVGGGLALGGLLIQGMKSKIRVFGKEITMGEGLLYSGGAYALYAYYNSSQEQKNQQEFNNKYGTDKSAQQANALLVAMNPSGDTWFRSLDGTNEEAIFKIASEITDWAKVQSYFKTLTGFELADALGAELSGEEIDRFHRLLNKQEAYTGSSYTLTRGQTVYIRQNMNVEVFIYATQKTTSIVAAKNTPVRVDDFVFRNGKKLVVYKVQKSTVFNGQDVAYIFAPEMLSPARVSGIGYIVNSQCATTECADGTFSTSTHPNACSHHGGIKNR